MIGSTDSHTGLATADEDNFFGKHAGTEPEPAARRASRSAASATTASSGWQQAASGYAAVWATENTREAIFDAMERKRDLRHHRPAHDRALLRRLGLHAGRRARAGCPADAGYSKGVPMGGDLRAAPAGKAPTFLVAALKDPMSRQPRPDPDRQGLDRRQGRARRRRSTTSPGRAIASPAPNGKLPAVGNTVDVANATWTNTIGASELITVWKDPDFDPALRAVYYARVIEIPTPRWTAYDAKRFGVKMPPEVPMTTQERAYTSPIWYTPVR